jgi:gas vesicle protein
MADKGDKAKKVAIGAAVGAAAGFVAGILLAPKSGKETRADLKKGAKKAAKAANKQLKHTHDELSKFVEKAEAQVAKMGAGAKKEASEALAKSKKARDQVATVMAAIKSGNSSDEDLDMAVKNAKTALESLKKFFKDK